jgi:hypothetical protein
MVDLTEYLSPLDTVEREELDKAFRQVFATAGGKRVLFWMLEQASIYRDPDCGENTHLTAGVVGEQRVGRKLIAMLDDIDPRMYPQLVIDRAEIKAIDKANADARAAKQEKENDHEDID